MPVDTKLSRMVTWLTMYKRLPLIKPYHSLITWPTWGHMAFSKIYISTLAIRMAIQLGRVLTSRRSFSTQTFKLPRTSSFLVFCLESLKFPSISEGVFSSYNFFFFTPRWSVRSVKYLIKIFTIVLVSYNIFSFSAKIIVFAILHIIEMFGVIVLQNILLTTTFLTSILLKYCVLPLHKRLHKYYVFSHSFQN